MGGGGRFARDPKGLFEHALLTAFLSFERFLFFFIIIIGADGFDFEKLFCTSI